VCEKVDRKLSH